MNEATMIRTSSGLTHRLRGAGTVCNPTKMPKGKQVTDADVRTTYDLEGNEYKRAYEVTCNKCNKVSHRGY